MKILCIADSHGSVNFPLDAKVDAVCTLGDVGRMDVSTLLDHYQVPILSVYGNADSLDTYRSDRIILLDGETVDINGVVFGGVGGIPIYSAKQRYYTKSEADMEEAFFRMGKVDVVLSHANPMIPYNGDYTNPDRGFDAFVDYMTEHRPKVWMHGHLHTPGESTLGETRILSVYPYAQIELD